MAAAAAAVAAAAAPEDAAEEGIPFVAITEFQFKPKVQAAMDKIYATARTLVEDRKKNCMVFVYEGEQSKYYLVSTQEKLNLFKKGAESPEVARVYQMMFDEGPPRVVVEVKGLSHLICTKIPPKPE